MKKAKQPSSRLIKLAWVAYRRIEQEVEALLAGLHSVVPESYLQLLSARELETTMTGVSEINVADSRACKQQS